MASELDLMLFNQHLEELQALPQADRWTIKRGDTAALDVSVDLSSRKAPQELYRVRLRWTDYSKPPSVKFVGMTTGSEAEPRAWPNFDGSRPTSFFVCLPITKEGHDHHGEWATGANAYRTVDDPLEYVLLNLQSLLDNTYTGRCNQ
ncbi:hypothetical protein [Roseateles microcysteis]|uniref:hypothetical protein n=1 Tax=Roseateles microcysteis TaxID=3119057 RepID=UPI002FE6A658